jgi:hypothetical protein
MRERGPRRQITREKGQAIEKLAHAIEYLCDEAVHSGAGTFLFPGDPQLESVQLLMSLQRAVYSECPPVVSMWTRIRTFMIHALAAKPAPEMTTTAVK